MQMSVHHKRQGTWLRDELRSTGLQCRYACSMRPGNGSVVSAARLDLGPAAGHGALGFRIEVGEGVQLLQHVLVRVDARVGADRFIHQRGGRGVAVDRKSNTSEPQSLMRISYAVFCLKKIKFKQTIIHTTFASRKHQ